MNTKNNNHPYGIVCIVTHTGGDILLLKRSPDKKIYPNKWAVVAAGPLPDNFDYRSFAVSEIQDEIGMDGKSVKEVGKIDLQIDGKVWKTYVYSLIVSSKDVKLNKEHTEFQWVQPDELENYDLIPGLVNAIKDLSKK